MTKNGSTTPANPVRCQCNDPLVLEKVIDKSHSVPPSHSITSSIQRQDLYNHLGTLPSHFLAFVAALSCALRAKSRFQLLTNFNALDSHARNSAFCLLFPYSTPRYSLNQPTFESPVLRELVAVAVRWPPCHNCVFDSHGSVTDTSFDSKRDTFVSKATRTRLDSLSVHTLFHSSLPTTATPGQRVVGRCACALLPSQPHDTDKLDSAIEPSPMSQEQPAVQAPADPALVPAPAAEAPASVKTESESQQAIAEQVASALPAALEAEAVRQNPVTTAPEVPAQAVPAPQDPSTQVQPQQPQSVAPAQPQPVPQAQPQPQIQAPPVQPPQAQPQLQQAQPEAHAALNIVPPVAPVASQPANTQPRSVTT